MSPQTGDLAPSFSTQDQHGNSHSLESFLTKGPLVLFFYPKDSSPGCTQQACSFRDSYASLLKFGVSIAGISKDSAESHQKFAENNDLPYPLLLDSKGKIHDAYGCNALLGLLTKRVTFVIGQDKRILLRYEDNFRMKSHVREVSELLEQL